VKGDDPDKKGHPSPADWGLGVVLKPHPVKTLIVEKVATEKKS
jgi:hypothetical protein